jgi:hypothetical protein
MFTLGDFRELVVKSVGKPDARNGHVRFDERGRETTGCQSVPVQRPSSTLPPPLINKNRRRGIGHIPARFGQTGFQKEPAMPLGVYEQLWELQMGFEQVRRALHGLAIRGGSRMRRSARTDLCGGRSAMIVPTASVPSMFDSSKVKVLFTT